MRVKTDYAPFYRCVTVCANIDNAGGMDRLDGELDRQADKSSTFGYYLTKCHR